MSRLIFILITPSLVAVASFHAEPMGLGVTGLWTEPCPAVSWVLPGRFAARGRNDSGCAGNHVSAAPGQPGCPTSKGLAILGVEGVQQPLGPTPGHLQAGLAKTHRLPSCHSRSPLHLSRHRQPPTLPLGSPNPGWGRRRKACSEAPRPRRSQGQPGVSRAAWTGPDQTWRAQVDASSLYL